MRRLATLRVLARGVAVEPGRLVYSSESGAGAEPRDIRATDQPLTSLSAEASVVLVVIRLQIHQREEVDLAPTGEVAATFPAFQGVSAAPIEREDQAFAGL